MQPGEELLLRGVLLTAARQRWPDALERGGDIRFMAAGSEIIIQVAASIAQIGARREKPCLAVLADRIVAGDAGLP